MINSSETLPFKKFWFDGKKYIKLQKEKILDRISNFSGWRLYLEIWWKFISDAHASRVLPGFEMESKRIIFSELKDQAEILFCLNAKDILDDRQLSSEDVDYKTYVYRMIKGIEKNIWLKPHIVINAIDVENMYDLILEFEKEFQRRWYRVRERYKIKWYPHDVEKILSEDWFGQDDHIPLTKNLVLVTGAASSSGKMSTCLWQIYLDHQIWIKSGYAKYETFPIWNLPVDNPINRAYEAATVDIGDYNCPDEYHKKAYWMDSTNYNRDVEAFEIVMNIAKHVVTHKNYMIKYKSPTDMWINCAGFAITDEEIVSVASLEEIRRRKQRYQEQINRWDGEIKRLEACDRLEEKCLKYISDKKFNPDLKIH